MASATATQGVAAGRPQPQTTVEPPGGPFVRHSQPGRRSMYLNSGVAFGGLVANPLVAAPGYTRAYRLKVVASGGTATAGAAATDFPGNLLSLLQLKDSFGTPLIVAPGYEALQLLQMFGGQYGLGTCADINNVGGTYSPVAAATGDFTFSTSIPLEFAKAYGTISSANASLLPTLQMTVNSASNVYSTAPSTNPTMDFYVDQDFYWLPEGVSVEPPGIGTTEQWVYQPANPTVGSGATTNIQLPRLGGYLSVIVVELRDSTSARVDAWPTRPRMLVDGVALLDSELTTIYEDMAIGFGVGAYYGATNSAAGTVMVSRPTGVLAINRKNGLSQQSLGLFDTGETYLSTNPGTQVEFAGTFGTISNAPATLNAICGQVVPSGALIQGLPEV